MLAYWQSDLLGPRLVKFLPKLFIQIHVFDCVQNYKIEKINVQGDLNIDKTKDVQIRYKRHGIKKKKNLMVLKKNAYEPQKIK